MSVPCCQGQQNGSFQRGLNDLFVSVLRLSFAPTGLGESACAHSFQFELNNRALEVEKPSVGLPTADFHA